MNAAKRWQRLVEARRAESERLAGAAGRAVRDVDARQARRFAELVLGTAERDPLLRRVRRVVRHRTTVLDVGSGPGRLTLPLASRAAEVYAVDRSPEMLAILRREARRSGLNNVHCVTGRWEDVDVPVADLAICSYVLGQVEDAAKFLKKLDAAARRQVFVCLGALSPDALFDPLWRYFHGHGRQPSPTYLDAVAVLRELDITPDVEIVTVPNLLRYRNLSQAVAEHLDYLLLPDTPEVRLELRGLLEAWLTRRNCMLEPPLSSGPAAILKWRGNHDEHGRYVDFHPLVFDLAGTMAGAV